MDNHLLQCGCFEDHRCAACTILQPDDAVSLMLGITASASACGQIRLMVSPQGCITPLSCAAWPGKHDSGLVFAGMEGKQPQNEPFWDLFQRVDASSSQVCTLSHTPLLVFSMSVSALCVSQLWQSFMLLQHLTPKLKLKLNT